MREAATKKRQQPPPPPPRFYSFNPSTGTINTTNNNDISNDHQSDTSKNSSMNDLSVLSPNLKSYLDKGTSSSPSCHTPNNSREAARNGHKRQQQQQEEEQVYSPHMAALSSPPFNNYYYHDGENNNDGLLHSIFSTKKVKRGKKKRRGAATRRRTNGRHVNGSRNRESGGGRTSREEEEEEEEEEDILELFSPGVQEFDLDEALAADIIDNNTDQDEYENEYEEATRIDNEGGGAHAEDDMTLDSVDRIVRGDYLKCHRQISHDNGGGGGGVSAEVAGGAMSFTSPTAAIGSKKSFAAITPPAAAAVGTRGEVAASKTPTTTPVMNNTVKTPTYSTPSNNHKNEDGDEYEQFYTPVQTMNSTNTTTNCDWAVQGLSTTSQRGEVGGGGSLSSSLAPVWEEAEEEEVDEDAVVGEELFFSPLAVGTQTPNQQQQQQQYGTLENESYNDTIIEEWENKNNLTEMMANEVRNGTNHYQQQQWQSPPPASSPKYSEMKEELQQMLVEAKKLTPCKEEVGEEEDDELVVAAESLPMNGFIADEVEDDKENVQPTTLASPEPARSSNNLNYSPPNTTPNSHRHHRHYHHQSHSSSTITSVSPEQITLDFVKQCNCLDTLKEILSRLSLDDRYPSLRRYVEKRIKVVTASSDEGEGEDELVERQYQDVVGAAAHEVVGNEGVDKENVLSEVHHHDQRDEDSDANIQEERRSVPPPLDTLTLSQSSREERNEMGDSNNELPMHHRHRQITPENQSIEERSESIMTHETSLDMNLSESLDDESFYWRQGGDGDQEDQEKLEPLESQPMKEAENFDRDVLVLDTSKEQYVGNDVAIAPPALPEDKCTPLESHTELQEKLAAHAQLTERVESLVKEHASIKAELTSKLDQAREQLSQRQSQASAEKEEYTKQVSHLTKINETLEQEIGNLKRRLEVVEQKAVDAASQAELQLDQTRLIQAKLSQENERLGKELDEARLARDRGEAEALRLKQILDERVANADINDSATKRIRKGLEAAKFANHALANALAISEKDLSEALHEKEKSARECNSLRERIAELEDKSSWLSSKVNEMTKELQSSHKYIDKLYSDLQSNRTPSKEMKAELERKQMQFLDLEHQYTRRIQELERQIAGQSGGSKVSMAEYVAAVREYRKHESEAIQKQRRVDELESTVSTLKQQIETMKRRPSPRSGISSSKTSRGKSISTMRSYGKKVHNVPSAGIENDENKAPSVDTGGKKIRRMTALKAVGGRKGLSEQLRRARRVGEEE